MRRLLIFAVSSAASAGPIVSTELDGRDVQLLKSVAENGVLLGSLGEVAQARARSELLKQVGAAIVNGRPEWKARVQRVAEMKGVTVANAADATQITLVDQLIKLEGVKFERACLEEMRLVCKKLIEDLQPGKKSADADIRTLTDELLQRVEAPFLISEANPKPSSTFRDTKPAAKE